MKFKWWENKKPGKFKSYTSFQVIRRNWVSRITVVERKNSRSNKRGEKHLLSNFTFKLIISPSVNDQYANL